jgi:hypothetical protein
MYIPELQIVLFPKPADPKQVTACWGDGAEIIWTTIREQNPTLPMIETQTKVASHDALYQVMGAYSDGLQTSLILLEDNLP